MRLCLVQRVGEEREREREREREIGNNRKRANKENKKSC